MTKNVAILFYLKKRANAKEHKVPVYMRITVDGQRVEIATGERIEPRLWDPSEGRAKGRTPEIEEINSTLSRLEMKINDTARYLKDYDEEITAEKIKNRYLGKIEKPMMLVEVFQEHNRKVMALVNREFAPATATRYETTLKHTIDFMQWKYNKKDIRVKQIDHHFITEFEFYLRSVEYIPFGFLSEDTVVSNSASVIYDAEPWIFGVISSKMHMAWVKTVAGRLKSDYRYSSALCYNNFPFPLTNNSQLVEIEKHVFRILEERELFSEKTLSQLYDPNKMPSGLKEAHWQLDLAVERCYRSKPFESDEERLEYLFKLYEQMIAQQQLSGTIFNTKKDKPKILKNA